jgi:hypothetical protein
MTVILILTTMKKSNCTHSSIWVIGEENYNVWQGRILIRVLVWLSQNQYTYTIWFTFHPTWNPKRQKMAMQNSELPGTFTIYWGLTASWLSENSGNVIYANKITNQLWNADMRYTTTHIHVQLTTFYYSGVNNTNIALEYRIHLILSASSPFL